MVFLPNNPVFRRLYAAQVSSLLGSGLLTVALALLAARLADDNAGAVLGTALTIKMVAYVAMAPVMRAACERLPRTTVLVGADIVRLLMVALLPLVTDVWQIYVLVFALQTASATFTPVFTATIPAVLDDRDDYTGAVAASRIAYDLRRSPPRHWRPHCCSWSRRRACSSSPQQDSPPRHCSSARFAAHCAAPRHRLPPTPPRRSTDGQPPDCGSCCHRALSVA